MNERVSVASETGVWLFVSSAVVGMYGAWRSDITQLGSLATIVSFPALASIFLLALAYVVPGVFAINAIRFPLNLTLPPLHVGICTLAVTMATTIGPGLQKLPDDLLSAKVWLEPRFILTALVVQVIALSTLCAMKRVPVDS